jgi:predicted DNA-binding WGR domain protein
MIPRPSPPDSRRILLRRIDPACNVARFYALSVEVTLFRDWSCNREFGRIGSRKGRLMVGLFDSEAGAEAALQHLLRVKLARGYREVAD